MSPGLVFGLAGNEGMWSAAPSSAGWSEEAVLFGFDGWDVFDRLEKPPVVEIAIATRIFEKSTGPIPKYPLKTRPIMTRTNTNFIRFPTAITKAAAKGHAVSSSILNRLVWECRAEGFAGFPSSTRMPWRIGQEHTSTT